MKKLSWIWMLVFVALVVGCRRAPEPSPEVEIAEPSPAATMPTEIEILPTPTPKPPPPTPTDTPIPPSPTPEPTATPEPTFTPEPTSTPVPTVEGETPVPTEVPPTPTPVPPTNTPTPPPPTPTPQKVAVPMIAIPAGEFTMGSANEIERPPHTVSVDAFEIDQFEVTNEDFEKFVAETGYVTGAEQAGETSWRYYAKDKPKHPVVRVSWNDANAFCAWAEKRLPTEAEWEKAARGTDGRTYPWGNDWDVNKANTKDAGYRGTIIVGSFPAGGSPYGVMDMAGNVAEWTSDWFQPYPGYPGGDSEAQYFGEKYRVIRGGGWFSDKELVRTTERSASSVELANDDVGFRCAK